MERDKNIIEIIELVDLKILPSPDFLIIPISYQQNLNIYILASVFFVNNGYRRFF